MKEISINKFLLRLIMERSVRCMMVVSMICLLSLIVGVEQVSAQNNPPEMDTLRNCTPPMTPIVICHEFRDPDGDATQIIHEETNTTFNCSLVAIDDTCFRYTPLPGFFGTDTIFVAVCDDGEPQACSTSLIYMFIGCLPPLPTDDDLLISTGAVIFNNVNINNTTNGFDGVTIDIIENDIATCGDVLEIDNIAENPRNGTFAILNENTINYRPNENFSGLDSIRYETCSSSCDSCATATVYINVLAQDEPCVTNTTDCVGPFNTTQICPTFCTINMDAIVQLDGDPQQGTLDPPVNNCFRYIPDAAFEGVDTVRLEACDALGNCETTLAVITVDPACGRTPPIAVNDDVTSPFNTPVNIRVTSNDFDQDGDAITITTNSQPSNGTININFNTGDILYTPANGFSGTDVFTYTICDPDNQCATATVTVTIEPAPITGCNEEPYEFCTAPLTGIDICPIFCDLANADSIEIRDAHTTFNCSLNLLENGCIRYTPLPGFFGTDTVELVGCIPNTEVCDTVYAHVYIGCQEPITVDDSQSTTVGQSVTANVLGNDTEICGNDMETNIVQAPTNGTAIVNADGTVTYSPNPGYQGVESIIYEACNICEDNNEDSYCTNGILTITIGAGDPINTPLNAQPDVVQTPFETAVIVGVLNNDEGVGLTVTTNTPPSNGTAIPNANGTITYTPNEGFSGVDNFNYTVCDSENNCEQALVSVTVLPREAEPQAPVANNDVSSTVEDTPVVISVLVNDTDPENGVLTISTVSDPPNGTAVPNANGTITYTPDPEFLGNDQFTYVVCDAQGMCDTATVGVSVGNQPTANQPPIAINDVRTTPVNTTISITVLVNDTDPNGDQIRVTSLASNPANGAVVVNGMTGLLTYTPINNFVGVDNFNYIICDDGTPELCDTATVTITIINDDPPQNDIDATNDTRTTPFETPIVIDVLTNDVATNPTITTASNPNNGTATVNTNGTITYSPNVDFSGVDNFTYTICDNDGNCDQALVTVTVLMEVIIPPNNAPIAVNDSDTTPFETPITVNILNNDTGLSLTPFIYVDPQSGSANLNPDETVTYQPNDGFSGVDVLTYIICDPQNLCDTALVTITVLPPPDNGNDPPIARDDFGQTQPNVPINIPVLVNDTEPDGEAIFPRNPTLPPNGTIEINADGTITYEPDLDYVGTDTFSYSICDGANLCDQALVTVTIATDMPVNLPPIAVSDSGTTPINTPIVFTVLVNDSEPENQDITITTFTNPSNGTVNLNSNETITYNPNSGYVGTDVFTYTICDPQNLCDQTTVTVNIISITPPANNLPPVANTDRDTTLLATPIVVNILTNDTEPEGQDLTVTLTDAPQNGVTTLNTNNSVTYTPNATFIGTDIFDYVICDTEGLCDTAMVIIVVLPDPTVIDPLPPVAVDDTGTTPVNTPIVMTVLANDSDPENQEITVTEFTQPTNGMVSLNANGSFFYTPNTDYTGVDTFEYTICDPQNLCDQATVTINITTVVVPPIDPLPPVANNDRDTTLLSTPITVVILNNDNEPEGQDLTVTLTDMPQNGVATLNADNSVTYTPSNGFFGTDIFDYVICDTDNLCDSAMVIIVVLESPDNGVNDPPIAVDDFSETPPSTLINIPVLVNDIEPEDEPLFPTGITNPPNGTVGIEIDGTINYTPDDGFLGVDTFRYTICDSEDLCDDALVTVTVDATVVPNQAPLAVDDRDTTNVDVPITLIVLDNDSDPDMDTLTVRTISEQPNNGSATINGDGSVTYSPTPLFTGIDTFTYIMCDPQNLCDTADVIVVILPEVSPPMEDLPPIAVDDRDTTNLNTAISLGIVLNDSDPNDRPLTATLVTSPTNGTATISNNVGVYTPNDDFEGTDMFTYQVCNDATPSLCDTAVVVIVVLPVLPPEPEPVEALDAQPDVVQTPFDTPILIGVLDNDFGENPTVKEFSSPVNGTVTLNEDGTILYSPDNGFSGVDNFFYSITDESGGCEETIVSVTVLPDNATPHPPTANNDLDRTPLNTPITLPVLVNDSDPENEELTITESTQPANGAAVINTDGTITYTPNDGFVGLDTFLYTICDEQDLCDDAVVGIVVGDDTPLNNPPIASPDSTTTPLNTSVSFDILGNDIEPDGDDYSIVLPISAPANGMVMLNQNGEVSYTPEDNFQGIDYFTYMICDDGTPVLCDTTYVKITVGSGNMPPRAVNDTIKTPIDETVSVDVKINDTDPNHLTSELRVSDLVRIPANGTATLDVDSCTITYVPTVGFSGKDSLQYLICDPLGLCDTGTLCIQVEEFPNAQPDIEYTFVNTPVDIDVLPNDEGSNISIKDFTQPEFGEVTFNPVENTFTYTPAANYVGTDYFFYTITDASGNCDQTIVNINIAPDTIENRPPIANNDVYNTPLDMSIEIDPRPNDTDPDNEPIAIKNVEQPTNGITALINDGTTIVYSPTAGFTGVDSFMYSISDPEGLCDTAWVYIGVGTDEPPNNPPLARDDDYTIDINMPLPLPILTNDTDPDGDDISVKTITAPIFGEVIQETDGSLMYIPNNGFVGTDYFVYVISDDGDPALCDTAYVTIQVGGDPIGEQIFVTTTEDVDTVICLEDFIGDLAFDIDTLIILGIPANGNIIYENEDSCITYSPDENYVGPDQIMVAYCSENEEICDTATVMITVNPAFDPPLAVDDRDTTKVNVPILIDVLNNDSDADGDDLSILPLENTDTPFGTIELTPDGILYTPDSSYVGNDTFTYIITDPTGLRDTAEVIIMIMEQPDDTIPPPPENPVIIASNDIDTTSINESINIPLLGNDMFPTDSTRIITVLTEPFNGFVTINGDSAIYNPSMDFIGTDSFQYLLCVNDSVCDTAWVTVTILEGATDDCKGEIETAGGFSPNGDGVNELFLIDGLDHVCLEDVVFKLLIYNRWGDVVYVVENYNNTMAWNGTYIKTGNPVPDGTYFGQLWFELDGVDTDCLFFLEVKR